MHVAESLLPQLYFVTRYAVFDPPWGGSWDHMEMGGGNQSVVIIPDPVSTLSLLSGSAGEGSYQWRELRARSKF